MGLDGVGLVVQVDVFFYVVDPGGTEGSLNCGRWEGGETMDRGLGEKTGEHLIYLEVFDLLGRIFYLIWELKTHRNEF